MSLQQVLYTARATATGGRDGAATSDDGRLNVKLSVPKGLGGDDGAGTNPEQLFAAGYAACFMGAMKFVAGQKKIALPADLKLRTTFEERYGKAFIPEAANLERRLKAMDEKAECDIQFTAQLADGTISFHTTTTFLTTKQESNYRMAYVVCEDQLPITQNNYYAGGENGENGEGGVPQPPEGMPGAPEYT